MGLSFVCKTRSCGCLRFRSQALADGLPSNNRLNAYETYACVIGGYFIISPAFGVERH